MYTWKLADALFVSYLESEQQRIADGQEIVHRSRKFVREIAKGLTAGLTNEQRITMLDMTVRHAEAAKEKQFHIEMPKNIIPVRINEPTFEEERMAAGAETQTVVIDLKKIRMNSEKRKE